jgi:hypothetical protein
VKMEAKCCRCISVAQYTALHLTRQCLQYNNNTLCMSRTDLQSFVLWPQLCERNYILDMWAAHLLTSVGALAFNKTGTGAHGNSTLLSAAAAGKAKNK